MAILKTKISTFLLALVAFGYGAVCLFVLLSSGDYLEPFMQSCYTNQATHKFIRLRGKHLDKFLCFITPFFEAALLKSGSIGVASFMLVLQMFISFMSVSMIESGRQSATGFVYAAFIVYMIGQLIGIATAIPAMYLPSLIINSSKPKNIKDRMVSPQVVFFAFIANVLTIGVGSSLLFGEHPYYYHCISLFQIVPLSSVLVIIFVRTFGYPFEAKVGILGSMRTKTFYVLSAFCATAIWYGFLFMVWKSGVTLDTLKSISKSSPESCVLFLLYDGTLLSISGAIAVAILDGISGLPKFLLLALVLGPGGSFLICARSRESMLIKELETLEKVESSKKKK
jgi:hypothetical protein